MRDMVAYLKQQSGIFKSVFFLILIEVIRVHYQKFGKYTEALKKIKVIPVCTAQGELLVIVILWSTTPPPHFQSSKTWEIFFQGYSKFIWQQNLN